MSNPVCPKCRASIVEPNPRVNGENRCVACGYCAPVRDFHGAAPAAMLIAPRPRTPRTVTPSYTGRELENNVPAASKHYWWQDND